MTCLMQMLWDLCMQSDPAAPVALPLDLDLEKTSISGTPYTMHIRINMVQLCKILEILNLTCR